jgi:hypothetical protein
MSTPLYAGAVEVAAGNGFSSPDPVTIANSSWTWDLQLSSMRDSLYARSTLNTFSIVDGGGGRCGGGIVEYQTLNPNIQNIATTHLVGQSANGGYADFIWDNYVYLVTFGWIVEGDNYCHGRLNMEIWV